MHKYTYSYMYTCVYIYTREYNMLQDVGGLLRFQVLLLVPSMRA